MIARLLRLFTFLTLFVFSAAVRGDITFSEIPQQFGNGATFGASWGDFDADGDPDLFVSNHAVALPSLYRNDGDDRFTPVFLPGKPWGGMTGTSDLHSAAWADFDNNGTQDLLLQAGSGGGRNPQQNWLFINRNGVLSDGAVRRNLDLPNGAGRTPLWVDWNNDGRLDVILSNARSSPPTSLFLQQADGIFTPSESQPTGWAQGGRYASIIHLADDIEPSVLVDLRSSFQIDDSVFSLEGSPSRAIEAGWTNTPQDRVFADLDGDLLTDVVVTQHQSSRSAVVQTSATSVATTMLMSQQNPSRQGVSFRSPHPITLTISGIAPTLLKAGAAGDALADSPTGTWVLDPNDWEGIREPTAHEGGFFLGYESSDQRWQFFMQSKSWYEVRVELESEGPIEDLQSNGLVNQRPFWDAALLLWDDEAQAFVDATIGSGLDAGSACQSIVAEDFDNDTDLDLYMTCTGAVVNADNMLFENLGDGSFQIVPLAGGAQGTSEGRSDVVASADYDLDGFVDLFVTNGYGGMPFFDGVNQLFRNTTDNQNHWIEIDLVGVESNRDGIGAKVVLEAGGVDQMRTRGGGMHNRAQNFGRLHFGLGAAETISSLTVYWPSGVAQRLSDIAANQILTIVEAVEPAPFDFNGDGSVDVADIDALVAEIVIGANDPRFDMSGDESVDIADVSLWLAVAASANGFDAPYLPGDTNLDGSVNVADLNAFGQGWLGHADSWRFGDFNADGMVDAKDLNKIGQNWLASISTATTHRGVPEPRGCRLLAFSLVCIAFAPPRARKRC